MLLIKNPFNIFYMTKIKYYNITESAYPFNLHIPLLMHIVILFLLTLLYRYERVKIKESTIK